MAMGKDKKQQKAPCNRPKSKTPAESQQNTKLSCLVNNIEKCCIFISSIICGESVKYYMLLDQPHVQCTHRKKVFWLWPFLWWWWQKCCEPRLVVIEMFLRRRWWWRGQAAKSNNEDFLTLEKIVNLLVKRLDVQMAQEEFHYDTIVCRALDDQPPCNLKLTAHLEQRLRLKDAL